ncbi:MAG: diiron oxygenase [Pseudomonadota bacterium]
MALSDIYVNPPQDKTWGVDETITAVFNWDYSDQRRDLLSLYAKGKKQQWDAEHRIDWSQELDPENPQQLPEHFFPLYGAAIYDKMSAKEKAELRRHHQAWSVSQFLHGEQGALLCAAKIVQNVPDMEAKFYAATQVIDEARHVEAYKRLLQKFGVAFPITGPLAELLEQVLRDSRWDMTYLGMQVVIEGLALAAFAGIRDNAENPLAAQVNAYVMQDEARHVAFGRLALREYYPHLSAAERDEREQFLVEACYLMRDRFSAAEVWQRFDIPTDDWREHIMNSEGMQLFRGHLFSRIVPVVKDIGLWGPRVTKAYEDMGVLAYAAVDVDALQAADDQIARDYDARAKHVGGMIDKGRDAHAAE